MGAASASRGATCLCDAQAAPNYINRADQGPSRGDVDRSTASTTTKWASPATSSHGHVSTCNINIDTSTKAARPKPAAPATSVCPQGARKCALPSYGSRSSYLGRILAQGLGQISTEEVSEESSSSPTSNAATCNATSASSNDGSANSNELLTTREQEMLHDGAEQGDAPLEVNMNLRSGKALQELPQVKQPKGNKPTNEGTPLAGVPETSKKKNRIDDIDYNVVSHLKRVLALLSIYDALMLVPEL